MTTWVIGVPGQAPRMMLQCPELMAQAQLKTGEVYFEEPHESVAAPHIISLNGNALEAIDIPIEALRRAIIININNDRDYRQTFDFSYDFATGTHPVQCRQKDMMNLSLLLSHAQSSVLLDNTEVIEFRAGDNLEVMVTPSEFVAMMQALQARNSAIMATAAVLKTQARSATTSEELEAIHWP